MNEMSSEEYNAMAQAPKRSKYGNVPAMHGAHVFHSKAERDRYIDLEMLQQGGAISDLELQPDFECRVNGKLICRYFADFRYVEDGQVVVEDVKGGSSTPVYRLKKKLVEALYPDVKIREVRR